jgi:hypothetical protein
MSKIAAKNIVNLNRLRRHLSNNVHVYYAAMDRGRDLSNRMYSWIDDYNDLRFEPGWSEYCAQHGSDESHNAGDLFA